MSVVLDGLLDRPDADLDDELATRLAGRYLDLDTPPTAAATQWIHDNREFLFFSDRGGYRWSVDTNAERAAAERRERGSDTDGR